MCVFACSVSSARSPLIRMRARPFAPRWAGMSIYPLHRTPHANPLPAHPQQRLARRSAPIADILDHCGTVRPIAERSAGACLRYLDALAGPFAAFGGTVHVAENITPVISVNLKIQLDSIGI